MKAFTLSTLALAILLSGCQPKQPDSSSAPQRVAATAQQQVASTPWWHDAVFYQIWPRSFNDTDADGHGDFNGMTAKLAYLQELGINALWLTPMFEAPSYHGYDFTEFYQVESDYGSMAEFEAFIQAADARGMKVILDLVINHISSEHEWFVRSAAGEAPYKDYFIWRDEMPAAGSGWGHAWSDNDKPDAVWHWNESRQQYYYAAFGASQPDVNLRHPDVVAEMEKMAKFWLDKGVAGFRLDAVRFAMEGGPDAQADTAETISYWQSFNQYVKSVNPHAYLVGEAWVDIPVAARYFGEGNGLDQGFDFEVGYKILGLLQQDTAAEAQFGTMQSNQQQVADASVLSQNVQQRADSLAPLHFFAPFLTNHDQERVAYQLTQHDGKAKLAAAMLFSSPGTPYIYYGEEIGLTQDRSGHDVFKRAPMLWDNSKQAGFTQSDNSWVEQLELFGEGFPNWWPDFLAQQLSAADRSVAAQQAQPNSIWQLYKFLIAQKKQRPELATDGSYDVSQLENGVVQITRQLNGSKTLFVLNLTDKPADISAINRTGLRASWAFDSDGDSLMAYGLLVLQSPE
ncbi:MULTISPECIES: alpha-amylase family glycosyl hydrolase [unclassified Arsukibacterium]|uniref:alpha-amylase family glycosyl hydrolase n=1 Tax=unclassified Arsukibacterium TaxID=2635278 RepID=UPI000C58AE58|nr:MULTISPECIES: alpha-amylase family glycosyl hydrolase [unclassified Arsukibacterium]MBM32947.1 alpha-amlyase [Rheinheimera sp.]|tara:strand:- start:7044 stop:8753 length:1710 start_codon:yes stop_codon:yes gene_type:complete